MPYIFALMTISGALTAISEKRNFSVASTVSGSAMLILSLTGVPVRSQPLIYTVLLSLVYVLIRYIRKRRFRSARVSLALVTRTVDNLCGGGEVLCNGRIYRAVSRDKGTVIEAGSLVTPRTFIRGICVL